MKTPYEVLGVHPSCPQETITMLYRSLAKVHHPDREGGDADRMAEINRAYELIGTPEARAAYDSGQKSQQASIEETARNTVRTVTAQMIERGSASSNFVADIRGELTRGINALQTQIGKTQALIDLLSIREKQISIKDSASTNLILETLTHRRGEHERVLADLKSHLAVGKLALSLVDSHEWKGTATPQPTTTFANPFK